jgi:hypothetical protein
MFGMLNRGERPLICKSEID